MYNKYIVYWNGTETKNEPAHDSCDAKSPHHTTQQIEMKTKYGLRASNGIKYG